MILVGVTGGIGAGKTTALRMFGELGVRTVDADEIVHRLYESGQPLAEAIARQWGPEMLGPTGAVDRVRLAQVVFRNPQELTRLNGLVHPHVMTCIGETARQAPDALFCGIPLLYETGWDERVACTVCVWCDRETQAGRLRDRGWTQAMADERIACQLPMDEKLRRSDFGIVNIGSTALLREQCRRVLAAMPESFGCNRKV